MLTEPDIPAARLIDLVERAYGLSVASLTFIPTGWLAYCYTVTRCDGQRGFLKMYTGARPPAFAASSPDFYLPLTRQLYTRGVLPQIAYPLPCVPGGSSGTPALYARRGDTTLILFNFIEGDLVGYGDLPDGVLAALGGMVGILHRSASLLDLDHPLVEQFQAAFEPALHHALDALAAPAPPGEAGAGIAALRRLVLPRRAELLAYLDRLHRLGSQARAARHPAVICHTDLHGGNLILDRQGRLHILDWENAMIAPKEHDLCFFADDERFSRLFLPAYEREAGPARLEPDLLRFYFYRRALEDLVDFVMQIMAGTRSAAQEQSDLLDAAGCLDGLGQVETTVAQIVRREPGGSNLIPGR